MVIQQMVTFLYVDEYNRKYDHLFGRPFFQKCISIKCDKPMNSNLMAKVTHCYKKLNFREEQQLDYNYNFRILFASSKYLLNKV